MYAGNKKMAEGLKSLIREKLPHLAPDDLRNGQPNLSIHYPHCTAFINPNRAECKTIIQNWKW